MKNQIVILFILSVIVFSIPTITVISFGQNESAVIDLLDEQYEWDTVNNARLNNTDDGLQVDVKTSLNEPVYNRIYTYINLSNFNSAPIMNLTYLTNSTQGDPVFFFEIRSNKTIDSTSYLPLSQHLQEDPNSSQTTYSFELGNTLGYQTTREYTLPNDNLTSNAELRFYVLTTEPTIATLVLKNGTISPQ